MTFKYEGEGWYVTRGGGKSFIGTRIPKECGSAYEYIGVGEHGSPESWTSDGTIYLNRQSRLDLLHKVKEKNVGWLNIYDDGHVVLHQTLQRAQDLAHPTLFSRIKVEYEEGQFDE